MAYVNSDKIRVFPSVGRSNYDIESQLMNENNISQIVRSLCRERKSYVLSTELNTGPFEFVIYGFYFKILDASNTLSSITSGEGVTEIWAGIKIDVNAEANNNSSNYQLLQLANTSAENNEVIELDAVDILDKEDQFQGIIFGTAENEVNGGQGENYHTLLLLTKDADSNTFKVPAKSLLHLNTTEILDGTSSNYISDKFTTKKLDVSESISDAGTLTVTGATTLSSNTSIGGNLVVSGSTTLNSNLTVSGVATINQEEVKLSKPTTITNSLTISGNNLNINNGKIAFSPFNNSDTSPLIYSEVASENTNLVFALSDDATDSFIFRTNTHDLGGKSPDTFTINRSGLSSLVNITAPTFVGNLSGNFTTSRTFTFSGGDISGSTSSNSGNYTITASIRNGAVTEAKIDNDAVTINKIKDLNVTTPKIADAAITNSKIASKVVTNDKIADSAVTNDKITDGTIKTEKLGFDLIMTLTVTGSDNEHMQLTLSAPTLSNK